MAAPRPAPTVAARRLDIRVLGPMEAVVDGRPLEVDTRKALAVLAMLAVEGRPFARDELAAMLWPESDDASARGALRRTLSVLRSGLGAGWLDASRSMVALEPGASVDLAVLDAAARSGDLDQLTHAAGLARGPFLAGFSVRDSPPFDDWRATWEVTAERLTAAVLDGLSASLEAAGDPLGAVRAASRRVDLNPLDEPAQRRLMLLLARSGNRAEAIRRYRACVAALDRELGVPPLAETTELYEAIRDDRVEPAVPIAVPTVQGEPAPQRLPMVGREAELGRALAAVDGATHDGRVIVVEGEAGIGKTRLVEAVVEAGTRRGSVAVTARAFAAERDIPYGPIVGLLHAGLARPDALDRIGGLPSGVLAELERLVPLPHDRHPDPARPAAAADALGARTRLLDALVRVITSLVEPRSGGGPGILALEDLQWADDATREVVGWLARRLVGQPVVLILTWRPEDLDGGGARFADAMGGLEGVTDIALGRLDREAVASLVDAADAPGDVDALYRESEGLPLYVVEALAAGGSGTDRPGGVRALLRERLASVGETGAQVLAAGAVLGRTFGLRLVRDTSGRTEEEVVEALEELVRRGLVRELGDGPEVTFDFAHARIRDAAYESTSLARRRLLHHRAADAMRSDASWRDAPGRLALVAGHLRAAGQDSEAAALFRDAGRRARALHAHREAVTHLETAIALGHPDIADAQLAIGESLTVLGDYRAAIAALEAAACPRWSSVSAALMLGGATSCAQPVILTRPSRRCRAMPARTLDRSSSASWWSGQWSRGGRGASRRRPRTPNGPGGWPRPRATSPGPAQRSA
jgi:DNA-binding SARP family transcriptional activator